MPSVPPLRHPRSKDEDIIAALHGIRKESVITSVLLLVISVVFVWAFVRWLSPYEAPPRGAEASIAMRAAESFGFTDIRITKTLHTGSLLGPCNENGTVHEADARNPQGRAVSILICCNSTNNCSIKTR